MSTVGIVGAGITGLAAAWKLSQLGIPFTLYESTYRPGGMIGSATREGFLVERGPSTILETSPRLAGSFTALGIGERRVFPSTEANRRFIVKSRRRQPLPQSALEFFKTPLLSPAGKARVALEPVIRKRRECDDEPLSCFVERRLGREDWTTS